MIEFVETEYRPAPRNPTYNTDEMELSDINPLLISRPVHLHHPGTGYLETFQETSFV